ncbi:hypothetical protein ACLB2K_063402 [Fragaria x ananassa]
MGASASAERETKEGRKSPSQTKERRKSRNSCSFAVVHSSLHVAERSLPVVTVLLPRSAKAYMAVMMEARLAGSACTEKEKPKPKRHCSDTIRGILRQITMKQPSPILGFL